MALPAHQHASSFAGPRTGARTLLTLFVLGLSTWLIGACNSGASGSGNHQSQGFSEGPGGKLYFDETHQDGQAGFLKIVEMFWGRLVDIHDLEQRPDPASPGQMILVPSTLPVFADFVINENIQTDGSLAGLSPANPISGRYVLETNPVTQNTRLIVLREFNSLADQPVPPGSVERFIDLVEKATVGLSPIQPKSDDPTTLPPFSFIARNAALILRMNDLMKDDDAAQTSLPDDVRVLTSNPPVVFFEEKRIFFDPNYGGFDGSTYHGSRIIIDMTVTQAEASEMTVPVGVNTLGLPPSLVTTQQANVAIRIPSKTEPSATQFTILKNLKGHGVATSDHGPVDFSSSTVDVVRAMRSGNELSENNGFLLDLNAPQLLGGWPVTVDGATPDPQGEAGFEFLIDLTFTTPCQAAPEPGNIIELPGTFIEVTQNAVLQGGVVDDMRVRVLTGDPVLPADLLGSGTFKRTFDPALAGVQEGCWLGFAPLPGIFPSTDISPGSQVILRFSEPMDPASITPFDTFMIGRVNLELDDLEPPDIVVGEVNPSADLKEFSFTPVLPLKHADGTAESYFVNLDGVSARSISDLAGNAPLDLPVQLEFMIDPNASTESNDGIVLRFSAVDEVKHPDEADGFNDVRGGFFYDVIRGVLTARPVVRSVATADRNKPVVSIMIPFGPGVQTPLSPLGSKLMHVWRYADVGFSVTEENNYNLDIEGL
ncbi:MAG: Ig-like domain-containing protein, partial [Planctomycetota bacterium]|nr:Ig-like domain-containing protein [Planctomycetota bacterium]